MEKYDKIRVVGRGAFGTVYLSWRLSDRKQVIIKQIPLEYLRNKEERQAALNEVKVLSMLDHPNIIEYYENFLEDKALMIVMEYAEGGTLFDYLCNRNGRLLEEKEIMRYFVQLLLSLQHVHSKQILHRDLKTHNILLDKKQQIVKISDFGISKVLSSKSKAVTVVGTPCYISPELCEGMPYNQKSDIWALGCVLYELASLKRAFEAQNLPALVLKIMRGTFAPISDHYSEDLRQLILTMLVLDPKKRPNINQIMAHPAVLNHLLSIYVDFGALPCRKPRPMSNIPRCRTGGLASKGSVSSMVMDAPEELQDPQPLSTVFAWGTGVGGGASGGGGPPAPTRLPLPNPDTQVTHVSTGRTQKAAVTKNGRLLLWEAHSVAVDAGTSGVGGTLESGAGTSPFIPRYLEGQSAVSIQHVSCGDLFTACLTDRGILMTFGSGANGCLGHGNDNDVSQAKIVEKLLGFEVTQVSCGANHVLAVTNEHEVFSWGNGDGGRLGLGSQDAHPTPQEVSIPAEYKPVAVMCSIDSSMVLTEDHQLLCCGSNRFNKLALDGDSSPVEEVHMFTPVQSDPLLNLPIQSVAMGTSHSVAVTDRGECYTFGGNQFGQLGVEGVAPPRVVQKVCTLEHLTITRVACGDTFTTAVSEDSQVWSWGKSARGRLGRDPGAAGETSHLPAPVKLPYRDPYSVVSLSSSHGNTLLAIRPKQRSSGHFKNS